MNGCQLQCKQLQPSKKQSPPSKAHSLVLWIESHQPSPTRAGKRVVQLGYSSLNSKQFRIENDVKDH